MLYSCNGLAKDRSHKGNREHMIRTFEQATRLMPPGVERWVWFADMHGFAMRDLQPVRTLFCIILVQMLDAAIGHCFWPSQACSTLHGFAEQETAHKAVAGLQIDQVPSLVHDKSVRCAAGHSAVFLGSGRQALPGTPADVLSGGRASDVLNALEHNSAASGSRHTGQGQVPAVRSPLCWWCIAANKAATAKHQCRTNRFRKLLPSISSVHPCAKCG